MQLQQLCRTKVLVRAGRGAFVSATALAEATPEEQHALRARAVAATLPASTALSHHSAACVLGLPFVGELPGRIHAVRTGHGQYRRSAHYTIHRAYPRASTIRCRGLVVVHPVFVLLGLAALHGLQQVVVAGDAALRARLFVVDQVEPALVACRNQVGASVLRAAVALFDAAAESPGETLTRLVLSDLGYAVESQVTLHDARGLPVARVDFVIRRHRVVIEFDGKKKYQRNDGSSHVNALVREKAREDRIRALGYEVVRLVWTDLANPARVRMLVDEACKRAARP